MQSKLCVSYTLYSKDRYKSLSLIQNIHIQIEEKSVISSKRTMSMQLCVCVWVANKN